MAKRAKPEAAPARGSGLLAMLPAPVNNEDTLFGGDKVSGGGASGGTKVRAASKRECTGRGGVKALVAALRVHAA